MPGRRNCLVPDKKKALVSQCFSIRPAGLEPATLGLEIPCSIHLSYGRVCLFYRIFLLLVHLLIFDYNRNYNREAF